MCAPQDMVSCWHKVELSVCGLYGRCLRTPVFNDHKPRLLVHDFVYSGIAIGRYCRSDSLNIIQQADERTTNSPC